MPVFLQIECVCAYVCVSVCVCWWVGKTERYVFRRKERLELGQLLSTESPAAVLVAQVNVTYM